ncbi:hypothetical protein NP233_g12210 [Leucocoprinus birnbaumii]|uniref:Uncharacterized protein n=1 Tax=Leucocoprinus birnbaumii TaxID=56174 RepID=A0AAD5VFI5_9AGAR|nr:hypothetical protein NP233_g12210 [Leucocoprinus birnbaumii]
MLHSFGFSTATNLCYVCCLLLQSASHQIPNYSPPSPARDRYCEAHIHYIQPKTRTRAALLKLQAPYPIPLRDPAVSTVHAFHNPQQRTEYSPRHWTPASLENEETALDAVSSEVQHPVGALSGQMTSSPTGAEMCPIAFLSAAATLFPAIEIAAAGGGVGRGFVIVDVAIDAWVQRSTLGVTLNRVLPVLPPPAQPFASSVLYHLAFVQQSR